MNGTGGAIMATRNFFINMCNGGIDQLNNIHSVILCADVPLVTTTLINSLFDKLIHSNVILLAKDTKHIPNGNYGYGRVKMNDHKQFVNIIEEKDCLDDEKNITIVNTGIYAFRVGYLLESLKYINSNNAQNEYYITDCPKVIKEMGINNIDVVMYEHDNYDETLGVNTPEQLKIINDIYNDNC